MLTIKCPDCGHLKVFHHVVEPGKTCAKESLSGCHFTIERSDDRLLECDCGELFQR